MVRDISAISGEQTLRDAARIIATYRYGGIPVVDEEHRVIGFISERDVVQSEFPQLGRSKSFSFFKDIAGMVKRLSSVGEQKVKDIMSKKPIWVDEEDTLIDVVRLILEKGVKVVPVVRDGLLVGVVGRGEVCRELFEPDSL